MQRTKAFVLATLLLAGIFFMWLLPSFLKSVPSRYIVRMPEPIQAMALPADPTPVLPTAAAPLANTQGLLVSAQSPAGEAVSVLQTDATHPPPPTPTPVPVSGAATRPPTPTEAATVLPSTTTPWPIPETYRMTGVSHRFQQWNNCGPATLAMGLSFFGLPFGQEDTAAVLKPDPEDRNVSPHELAAFVNNETNLQAISRSNGNRHLLQQFMANDILTIIEIGIDPPGEFRWLGWYGHYLLPVAYDDELEQFWVYDSWFGTSEEPLQNADSDGRVLTYEDLETYWPHFNRNYIIIYPPEKEALVAEILGSDLDDDAMWQSNLEQTSQDAASDPDNAFYWFNLGTVYNALGNYEKAATAYDQARANGLPWRMLWYQFGPYEAYYQTGRYEDIIVLADITLKDRPYFEESFYYRALAQAGLGNSAEARTDLESAAAFNPNYQPAAEALANLENSD